ncbi:zinc finger protein 880-like [Pectinophora gossypiella]|uniref:zinc finger protein 880-like n=1 Tax=Pectinophora gossypiella TaxID=13191 RepID=UPI00214F4C93|nr:zinc finger protein 880-like [Pectinophora gossypiella]
MNVCRICLSSSPEKDLCHLNSLDDADEKSYAEIMFFCLDIQVVEDSKITRKLCMKCYTDILSFYKFKRLALKNDSYLKTLANCVVKLMVLAGECAENTTVKHPYKDCDEIDCHSINAVEEQLEIKQEEFKDEVPDYESDEEHLSVIKVNKCEQNGDVETKAPVKKQGNQKLIKTNAKKGGECGQTVRNRKQHALRHRPRKDRQPIKCQDCDKTFNNYNCRTKHYRTIHLGIKKYCKLCNKDFVNLETHNLIMHNSEMLRHVCAVCGRRCITPSNLRTHMLIHNKDRPYECDICHKRFRNTGNVSTHKRTVHERERSKICHYCSKSFFTKYQLENHLRIHTKEKPYKCSECDKGFTTTTQLNSHKLSHSDQRNFRCKYCNKGFATPSGRHVHQLIHTTEKTHPCRYCSVKFRRTDQRRAHEVKVHERHAPP